MPMSFGDVAQDERAQVLDPVVEERPLVAHDRVGDLVDRPLALVEALDQPDRRAHLVLEVVGRLRADRAVAAAEHPPVRRGDAELRQPVLGQLDDVLVADLADGDVGLDVDRALARVLASRLGLEVLDDLEGRLDLATCPTLSVFASGANCRFRNAGQCSRMIVSISGFSMPSAWSCSSRQSGRSNAPTPGGSKRAHERDAPLRPRRRSWNPPRGSPRARPAGSRLRRCCRSR